MLLPGHCFSYMNVFHLYFEFPEYHPVDGLETLSLRCILYFIMWNTHGREQLRWDPCQHPFYKRWNYTGKFGYSYQRPLANTGRSSTFVKKYNFQYFLNIPDNSLIFLLIPILNLVDIILEYIWSINSFQLHHVGVGKKKEKRKQTWRTSKKCKEFLHSKKVIHTLKINLLIIFTIRWKV